jgi:AcrR family transcriptional regulator
VAEAGAVGIPLPVDSMQTPLEKLRPGPGIPRAEVRRSQRARISHGMVEAVAEQGYRGVTIRGLTELAEVSSRTFYNHFSGKEDCFRAVHSQLASRLVVSVAKGRESAPAGGEVQVRRMLSAFASELSKDPLAARLLLVEVHAEPSALEQEERAAWFLGKELAAGLDGIEPPRLAVVGLGAGALSVARSYLLSGRLDELRFPDVIESLAAWVLSYRDAAALGFLAPLPSTAAQFGEDDVAVPSGDRDLLLAAAMRLAAANGPEGLTSHQIASKAGLSRPCFDRHFTSAEDCLSIALATRVGALIERAYETTAGGGKAPIQSLYSASAALHAGFCSSGAPGAVGLGAIPRGEHGVGRREVLIAQVAKLIEAQLPPGEIDGLRALASAGAFWNTLEADVGRTDRARREAHAAALTQLLMALPSSFIGEPKTYVGGTTTN